MNILICDDDQEFLDSMVERVKKCPDKHLKPNIVAVSDYQKLINQMRIETFDVAFLDIEIGKCSGIKAAETILDKNPKCLIIFVTSFYSYVTAASEVQFFQYLHKPFDEEVFQNIYKKIVDNYKRYQSCCAVNTTHGKIMFEIYDILYIETYYDCLKIVTKDHSYYSNIKNLKRIRDKTVLYDFIQIHQSFLVNMNHIHDIQRNTVYMDNEDVLPIAARKGKEIMLEYHRFLMKSNDEKTKKE